MQIQYEDRGGGYVQIRFNNIMVKAIFERIGFEYRIEGYHTVRAVWQSALSRE